MKFKFKLDTLLKYNSRLEEIKKIEYSKALAQVEEVRQEIEQLIVKSKQARQNISLIEAKGGNIGSEINLQSDLILSIKKKIEIKKEQLQQLTINLEDKREQLTVAAQESRKIEKLKEKQLAEYKKIIKNKELKSIDELVITKFNRNK